jgi:glycosyltransferase involved in cell wall biosynthesis
MAKVLLFFTNSYPFGKGETFIENEMDYLAKAFDKIIIISNDIDSAQTREVPDHVILYRKTYELGTVEKIIAIKMLLTKTFWQEYSIIKNKYNLRLSKTIFNTMLQSLYKAKKWQPYIQSIIIKQTKKFDSIYLYSYWNNDMALACAISKMKNPRYKSFSRMHGWDVYFEVNDSGYLPYRKFLFTNLDSVFSISKKGLEYYTNKLEEIENKIKVSYLGIKENSFKSLNINRTLQILTISNLIPIKNIETLIIGLGQLNIPFFWSHIGSGPLKNQLEELAENLIPDKYKFIGSMTNQQVIDYFRSHHIDLFINISYSEGIPVSIMEAMSFGVPCIATMVGGNPEIVNNENGYLLPSLPSPNDVVKAIVDYDQLPIDLKNGKRKSAYTTGMKNLML